MNTMPFGKHKVEPIVNVRCLRATSNLPHASSLSTDLISMIVVQSSRHELCLSKL